MALTATATQGFVPYRKVADAEVLLIPGDPGVTYERGNTLTALPALAGGGIVTEAADSTANVCGVVQQTTVCPAATQGFPYPSQVLRRKLDAENLTLVPVVPKVPAGTQVYKATFANHKDDTVISYTAATRAIACTTGFAADDYPNNGLLYVYEGTGAGQVNVVEDYDHTGGAAELLLICHRAFAVALDSTSKFIVVSGEAVAEYGIGFFCRMDADTVAALDAGDGAQDGDWVVYLDFREAAEFLKNLTLPVVPREVMYSA